jgi:arginyl-tRNA synthetase
LIDLVKDHVREVMQKSDVQADEKEAVAEQIAIGALKYAFLHMNKERNVDFDIEAATDLHGDSGPYIQYAYARAKSIVAAVHEAGIEPKAEAPQTADERFVARLLMQFPDVVARAQSELAPHHVAQYAYELASAYNTWYAKDRVVGTPDAARRAALTEAVAITLKNALGLLGIQAPEKM